MVSDASNDSNLEGNLVPTPHDSRDEDLAVVEITVLAIVMICALAGNSFVLIALWQQRTIRPLSRVYLLMGHLSIADLLVALLNVLPQLIWDITYRFRGGDELCRSVKFFQIFVLYLSTFLMVAMALDRYLAVTKPSFGTRGDQFSIVNLLVVSAWILAALFAIPQPFIFSLQTVQPDSTVTDCWATFWEPWGQKAYVLWFVITILAIPVFIISFCYGTICGMIWRYERSVKTKRKRQVQNMVPLATLSGTLDNKIPSESGALKEETADSLVIMVAGGKNSNSNSVNTPTSDHRQVSPKGERAKAPVSKAKIKTIRLTLTVVICFFLCWSPFCFAQVCLVFKPPSPGQNVSGLQTILLLLASLNSCTNPWIYLVFSGSLFNQLRHWCGLGLRRARPGDECSVGDEEPAPPSEVNNRAKRKKGVKSDDLPSTGHTDCA